MPIEERRDSPRVELLGAVEGEMAVVHPVAVKEISPGGALVETSFPLRIDSLHDHRLTLGRPLVVKGRVVHSSVSDVDYDVITYRSGIEFVDTNERVATAIADYLKTTRAERGV
jgi:hypothetical protein